MISNFFNFYGLFEGVIRSYFQTKSGKPNNCREDRVIFHNEAISVLIQIKFKKIPKVEKSWLKNFEF